MACTIPEEVCHFSTTIHAEGTRSRRRCRAVATMAWSNVAPASRPLSAEASPRKDLLTRTPNPATNLRHEGDEGRQAASKCAPAFNDEAGERSATRLIVDAIAREDRHLESRGRGRPWISPRLARWHGPPQRCSFCSLLPSALSHHDMSYAATADRKQGNPARAHAGHCTPMQFAVRQGARGPAGPEDPGERSRPLADSERVACALNARPHARLRAELTALYGVPGAGVNTLVCAPGTRTQDHTGIG